MLLKGSQLLPGNDRPEKIEIKGWPFRVQQPEKRVDKDRVLLLLHGHLGNENVMWILTKPISNTYTMLAPRAPIKIGPDQYSWHAIEPQWPGMDTYQELTGQLLERVDIWIEEQGMEVGHYDVMGFSQGTVMAYALSILHPAKIGKVAALAGFLPEAWHDYLNSEALSGKAFFIAHGTEDDIVPISKARKAAKWLTENGAQVTFCEADTGHKLSANCFNGLGEFFS